MRTLRGAVERGRVHHAYLFVGSRGTGKTSMAKIFAACLNCERGSATVQPCGECESCRAIAAARSLDVIEMDAASNNSVDDIRELRESVAFAPVSGRSKVYILDEAHMLSQAAWNAFLKTLEEPPPDTVFVLATTEAQKVPATVVDRCHRFDFQRPTVEQIAGVRAPRGAGRGDRDPPRGGGGGGARSDRQLPRRARDARAAAHLHRPPDRAGGRASGAGGDRFAAPGGDDRRGATGQRQGGAAGGGAMRRERPRRGRVRGRPRGARARAPGGGRPRGRARGAVADARGGRAPARAGGASAAGDRGAPARAAGRRPGGGEGGRGAPHAAGARPREGLAARRSTAR